MKRIESLLEDQPFAKGMKLNHVEKIAECASYLELPGGQYIFRQGGLAQEFFLILNGTVEIEFFSAIGGPVILEKIGTGAVFGMVLVDFALSLAFRCTNSRAGYRA